MNSYTTYGNHPIEYPSYTSKYVCVCVFFLKRYFKIDPMHALNYNTEIKNVMRLIVLCLQYCCLCVTFFMLCTL